MIRPSLAIAAVLSLSLSACAGHATAQADAGSPASTVCDAAPAQSAIGKPATPELVERVRIDSHSRVVRVLHPGEIITMEFSAERVNLRVDGNNVVLAVTCG
jgi:hypothetical protein